MNSLHVLLHDRVFHALMYMGLFPLVNNCQSECSHVNMYRAWRIHVAKMKKNNNNLIIKRSYCSNALIAIPGKSPYSNACKHKLLLAKNDLQVEDKIIKKTLFNWTVIPCTMKLFPYPWSFQTFPIHFHIRAFVKDSKSRFSC